MLHRLFFLSLFLGWLPSAHAQTTYTFKGGIFVSPWDNPATWTPNGVPGPLDTAVISILPGTNSALMFHDSFSVGTLRIRSYFDLLGPGMLTVNDSMLVSYPGYCFIDMALAPGAKGLVNDADYSGPGAFHVFNKSFTVDGILVYDAASVSVVESRINGKATTKRGRLLGHQIVNPSGMLVFDAPSGDTLSVGRVTNKGTVIWKNGHLRNIKRRFINEGTWHLDAQGHTLLNDSTHVDSLFVNAGTLHAASVQLYTHFVNSGSIKVNEDAVLTLEDGLHYHGGALSGGAIRLQGDTSVAFTAVTSSDLNRFEVLESVLNVFEPFKPADTLRIADAIVEGIGSLSVDGFLDWQGGTMYVPVHVFPGASALIRGGQLPSVADASFFNEGEVVQHGAFFQNNDCINAGLWSIDGGQPAIMVGNGSFQNHGSVLLCGDASITFNLPVTNHPSGRFEGEGAISFDSLNNLGLTAPGCTIGTLAIANDFSTGSSVTINVEGGQLGSYDRLVVFGDIAAGGTLRIETPPGFMLTDTIDYLIFSTGIFIGEFDNVVAPPNYKVIYRPNGVSIFYNTMVGTSSAVGESPWQLSPTLATHEVRLTSGTTTTEDQTVWVRDAQGRNVHVLSLNKGIQGLTIPVADLPAGLYHVQVGNGGETQILQFVKL